MSGAQDSEDDPIRVDTIATVEVPRSKLSQDMSDEELRKAVLRHGDPEATPQELAQNIGPIRDKLEGDS